MIRLAKGGYTKLRRNFGEFCKDSEVNVRVEDASVSPWSKACIGDSGWKNSRW